MTAGFRSDIVVLPVQELMDAVADRGSTFPCVTLRPGPTTESRGSALAALGGALTKALKAAVDGLAELVIGENLMRIEAILAKLAARAGIPRGDGLYTLALSALDVALWDIKGKALGQPLWQMLGGCRDVFPPTPAARSGGAPRSTVQPRSGASWPRRYTAGMKTQLGLPGNPTQTDLDGLALLDPRLSAHAWSMLRTNMYGAAVIAPAPSAAVLRNDRRVARIFVSCDGFPTTKSYFQTIRGTVSFSRVNFVH